MTKIISTVGEWTAEADVLTAGDEKAVHQLEIALAAIEKERVALRAAHVGENPSIGDEEYRQREAVLDDLERQYHEIFDGKIPEIIWVSQFS